MPRPLAVIWPTIVNPFTLQNWFSEEKNNCRLSDIERSKHVSSMYGSKIYRTINRPAVLLVTVVPSCKTQVRFPGGFGKTRMDVIKSRWEVTIFTMFANFRLDFAPRCPAGIFLTPGFSIHSWLWPCPCVEVSVNFQKRTLPFERTQLLTLWRKIRVKRRKYTPRSSFNPWLHVNLVACFTDIGVWCGCWI